MYEYMHCRLIQEAGMTFLEFLESRRLKLNLKKVERDESEWAEDQVRK